MTEEFLLDRAEVRRAFDHAAADYDAHAVLQREIGDRLLTRLDFMKLAPGQILDAGAGTGYALAQLRARYPAANLLALDIAPTMLVEARAKFPVRGWRSNLSARFQRSAAGHLEYVCGDMERLPFPANRFDFVWSSLALQWANDLEATLRGFHHVLAPGGLLLFATFGPDTLKELRAAFAEVDAAPHVNGFADLHDIGDMLVHAGFANPVMEMEMLTLTYADLKTLMLDLKGIGAHNATAARRRGLMGKRAWQALQHAYERYRADGRLPASYEVIYGHAWAGDKTRLEDGRQVITFKIANKRMQLR